MAVRKARSQANPSLHRPMKNGSMRVGMSLCFARRHRPARRAIDITGGWHEEAIFAKRRRGREMHVFRIHPAGLSITHIVAGSRWRCPW